MTHAARADYVIRRCEHAAASALVRAHHYAGGTANTSVLSVGAYRAGQMVAAALWMPPTRVCAESVSNEHWRRVLSLSRLVVIPGEPTNVASMPTSRKATREPSTAQLTGRTPA